MYHKQKTRIYLYEKPQKSGKINSIGRCDQSHVFWKSEFYEKNGTQNRMELFEEFCQD